MVPSRLLLHQAGKSLVQSRTVQIPFGHAAISIGVKDPSSEWHLRFCGALKEASIGFTDWLPMLFYEQWFLDAADKKEACPVAAEHLKDMVQARNCARDLLNSQELACFADIGRVHGLAACEALHSLGF